jgi:hypothetical protein
MKNISRIEYFSKAAVFRFPKKEILEILNVILPKPSILRKIE